MRRAPHAAYGRELGSEIAGEHRFTYRQLAHHRRRAINAEHGAQLGATLPDPGNSECFAVHASPQFR